MDHRTWWECAATARGNDVLAFAALPWGCADGARAAAVDRADEARPQSWTRPEAPRRPAPALPPRPLPSEAQVRQRARTAARLDPARPARDFLERLTRRPRRAGPVRRDPRIRDVYARAHAEMYAALYVTGVWEAPVDAPPVGDVFDRRIARELREWHLWQARRGTAARRGMPPAA